MLAVMQPSNQRARNDSDESTETNVYRSPGERASAEQFTGGRRSTRRWATMPTETKAIGRRRVLSILGGGLAFGASSGVATARRGGSELAQQLNEVRAGTRKYRDFGTARDDGYEPVLGFVPGMGFHFVRVDLIAVDHTVGPVEGLENPPILVYFTTGDYDPEPGDAHDPDHDDDLRLGAVEYAHMGDPGAPGDYFADDTARRHLKTSEEEGWEFVPPAGVTALHVWVHRGNPAGVFNPTNPTIG